MLTERVIGLKLKGLRESNNITQQYLAKKLGVSRQAVCMWESGKRELRATMLSKIARLFDVSVDHILNPKYEKKGKEGVGMVTRTGSVISRGTTQKITFEYTAPDAKKVLLAGSFNGWNTKTSAMKKEKGGVWKKAETLKPGRYEYKFIVDGQWRIDPTNHITSQNTYGSQNSVKEVR
jgi:transcriptional regulator with XRE-family HTH domain